MKRNLPATDKNFCPLRFRYGQVQSTMFKQVGDIKNTIGRFQLMTINLRRLSEIDMKSKVIYWLI